MFKYNGNNEKLKKAVKESNSADFFDKVFESIDDADQFDMTEAINEYIAYRLGCFLEENDITVEVYYPKWRWSKAIGYFTKSKPTTIHVNGYKLNRSVASMIGNFYHELTHMVSADDDFYSFDHGSNDPTGKENTAPYAIGEIAGSLVDVTIKAAETGGVKPVSLWQKILRWFR